MAKPGRPNLEPVADTSLWDIFAAQQERAALSVACEQAIKDRDEAREVAFDYYQDLAYMGDYLFQKHHGHDLEEYPWLKQLTERLIPRPVAEEQEPK